MGMTKRRLILAVLVVSFAITAARHSTGQRRRRSSVFRPSVNNNVTLLGRVQSLELRVAALERMLSVAVPAALSDSLARPRISVDEAQRQLAAAEARLEHSRRMARKGYITPFELAAVELEAKLARLALARAEEDPAAGRMVLEIEVFNAEQDVATAEAALKVIRARIFQGFASSASTEAEETVVAGARQRLDAARQALQTHNATAPQEESAAPQ